MGTVDRGRSALVVGAGIGGLVAANALARRGWAVEVVEIGAVGRTAGWGLTLTGPSLRALDTLGLAGRCLDGGYGMSVTTHVDAAGVESPMPLPRLLGPDRPAMAGIARPDLHRILLDAARARGVVVRNETSVSSVHQENERTRVGLTDATTRVVDLLVGADGLRSAVRGLIDRPSPIRYHGQMVWRALISRPDWATGIFTFFGAVRQCGIVPIAPDRAYVFLVESKAEPDVLPDAELPARMLELLPPGPGRVAEVRRLVAASTSVVRRPVQTTLVEAPWSRGSSVLIGDAAHAPSPQMASGAALAIEDGVVLAEELDGHDRTDRALEAFVSRRRERCATLVNTSVTIAELEQQQRYRETHPLMASCHELMASPL
ncbi:FAD-dependent monooxygenase [Amycolatopsis sp. PS_44_ISF1]|uniref:FAD-dependent monooxygenase n=1 Tax=Amycolatopsis sp. PS_44_ISF1 TaxID=2974917 RepID=UPI0028DF171A|nr:FAD-dependent monooxygenase [Amycolatopsis sp. PS_44_ISF1]MDT8910164.1 FAD-dependent monooxygenase [Amycolatopsis sp. PS_44_ISF1]